MDNYHLIIPGVQKGGTTWIQHLLDNDDNFFLPSEFQEVHYFDAKYNLGINYYKNLYSNFSSNKITCDVTPDYLFNKEAAKKIYNFSVNEDIEIKFIVIFREPISRLFSAYKMYLRQNRYNTLQEAIEQSPHLIRKGKYYTYLKNYLNFFNKDQFEFLFFDDLKKDNTIIVKQIEQFLGLNRSINSKYTNKNINSGGLRKFNYIDNFFSWWGRLLRTFNLNKIIHFLKTTEIIRKINKLNKKDYLMSKEEKKILEKIKFQHYKKEVYKLSTLINKPDLIDKWGY